MIRNSDGEGRSQKPTFLKESMKLNWNFQEGGVKIKNVLVYRYFLDQQHIAGFISMQESRNLWNKFFLYSLIIQHLA